MPLRAYVNNEEIISIDLNEIQWDDLKRRLRANEIVLKLPCCNQEGSLKVLGKGLRYFGHTKHNKLCDWKPESPEHLKAKIEIIEACKENGWRVIPEFSKNNLHTDVLAIQNKKQIAFEVQWNKQTFEEIKRRQDEFRESGVRGCWFFRTASKELREHGDNLIADREIPAFKISKDEQSKITVKLKNAKFTLKSFVDSLLEQRLKLCQHIQLKPKQEVTIVFFDTNCWKCHKPQHLWTVKQNLVTVCNQDFYLMGSMWDSADIDKNPKIYEAVMQFSQTEKGKHLKIGQLKERYSNTVEASYLSHGCFYCDSIFGDFHLAPEKLEMQNVAENIQHKIEIEFETIREEGQHWCFSDHENDFCE